jgi:hypothetical protein
LAKAQDLLGASTHYQLPEYIPEKSDYQQALGQGRCITETNSAIANTIGERVAQSILDRADQLRKRSLAEYMLGPRDEINRISYLFGFPFNDEEWEEKQD